MASRVAVAVLAAFVFLDLAKFFISERFGTGAAWLLQQDVRALRRSVAQATRATHSGSFIALRWSSSMKRRQKSMPRHPGGFVLRRDVSVP